MVVLVFNCQQVDIHVIVRHYLLVRNVKQLPIFVVHHHAILAPV